MEAISCHFPALAGTDLRRPCADNQQRRFPRARGDGKRSCRCILLVGGLVWLAGLRQAFGIIEAVSQGRLTARERPTFRPGSERKDLPRNLLAIFLTWSALIAILDGVSTTLHWTMLVFFCLGLPASVMTLSVSNSLRQALDPVKCIFLMRQVGKPYLLLLFYLFLLAKGAPYAVHLLIPRLGDWLILPALTWTVLYFTVIMFAMMG